MRTLIVLFPLIISCVTQSTYDALKAEHEASTAKLSAELAASKAALAKEQAKVKELDALLKGKEAEILEV